MARLCAADYDRILVFLREAHAVSAEEPFPLHIVERLRELVPSAAVTFREWEGARSKTVLASDEPEERLHVWSTYGFVRSQDPFPGGPGPQPSTSTPVGRAVKFSDVLSRRQLHRLELYDVILKPLAVEDTMKLFLSMPHGSGATFVFDRERRAFTERDRAGLDALSPHLHQLLRTRTFGGIDVLTKREREVLDWVARGKTNAEIASILWIAPGTVRKHLDNVYAKLDVSNRAEAVASRFR
jgi:DNA-binding CsgD family transcriptional regulator